MNAGLLDYLSNRYDSEQLPRLAILPFNVPENFAPPGNESHHYGRDLAQLFHRELLKASDFGIIEVFNRDRWPGKRAEFNAGNYQAMQLARNAGYDFVLVGYLEDIINETDLSVLTRVIDTSNGVTVWYGRTVVYSNDRPLRRTLAEYTFGFVEDRPDLFGFPERAERMARCTVEHILKGEVIQEEQPTRLGQFGLQPPVSEQLE
ncbi:MAG: hypothetical protein KDD69_01085 [Bdellovibrionales bacterium]|nr:hypothetical protein [Bdellovibrionales bacterium]